LEAQFREALLAKRAKAEYQHQRATYPNHIWATDFVFLTFLGTPVALCVVYDEFSQAYLSLKVSAQADHQLAKRTLQDAMEQTSTKPVLIRRDNGKPFITEEYQQLLETAIIKDYPIPPYSPWYNGSLESCNTSLKAAIKTAGMQDMAESQTPYSELRKKPDLAQA
jgi:transposase InsO family protein